jgi:UDP-N-acetyl-D-galactosamine dehydrogenase
VQVHDSFAETKDVEKEYRITPQNLGELQPAQAVVLAVSHENYVSGGWGFISGLLLEKEGVVYDVKGVLDRSSKPENIYLERL